ncbi:MAG TPA: pyridoxal phosphate-dependent aminotransferase [Acidimicrobiales bacterium]|nr:pyridoxal phosphate-dependent aminotransferase [Acidimicrobiales bacterium]
MTFRPAPYPYSRLASLRAAAAALAGGAVDLSLGSPCDPPSPAALQALRAGDADWSTRGYPASAGSAAAREAAAAWMARRFGVRIDPGVVALCIGAKEFIAGLPAWLHLRDPSRDAVLYPALAYPSYAMGAELAGLRAVPVPMEGVDESKEGSVRMNLEALSEADQARALVLWVNSPGNPAGQTEDLAAAAAWGRERGILVASDECYAELTWNGPPRTILAGDGDPPGGRLDGVLAVHSLSKRSNLAGLRFAWYTGDPAVVRFLVDVRQHAGLMVPGVAQRAGTAALADQEHAEAQRARYMARLVRLRELLACAGVAAPMPEGGIYLWGRAPGEDGWTVATRLAEQAGLVVSPGEFYGTPGVGHVRVAAVAPLERLEFVASRLASRRSLGAGMPQPTGAGMPAE